MSRAEITSERVLQGDRISRHRHPWREPPCPAVFSSPDPIPTSALPLDMRKAQDRHELEVLQGLERAHEAWRRHWQERRSHQRYPLGTPFSCNLELDSGHYPPMPVQLQDISQGGACLLISSLVELRRGEMGELRRHGPGNQAGDPLDRRRLRVCWQEVREWITAVGVAFDPPLEGVPEALTLESAAPA